MSQAGQVISELQEAMMGQTEFLLICMHILMPNNDFTCDGTVPQQKKKGHAEICSAFICETKHNFKFMVAQIKVQNEFNFQFNRRRATGCKGISKTTPKRHPELSTTPDISQ